MYPSFFPDGALHERSGRFFDGFGGGRDREGILRIMKDSHIGSYGVLGLMLLPALILVIGIFACALFPGCCAWPTLSASLYAVHALVSFHYPKKKKKTGAKVVLYPHGGLSVDSQCARPDCCHCCFTFFLLGMLCFPCVLFIGLGWLLKRRLGGYTGDCCGALFLLCELACWMGAVVMAYNFNMVR